ncbi:hypothetical protein BKA14_001477 [Actinoplanes abujensis]|uniref:Uncharacterized protein n=1 Tax=Paractinoplanes abujensis TaxID=882441 RepID=A0A7W7G084_9ACTN|nr:hypothetical protein [Actinoplanes abujensis]
MERIDGPQNPPIRAPGRPGLPVSSPPGPGRQSRAATAPPCGGLHPWPPNPPRRRRRSLPPPSRAHRKPGKPRSYAGARLFLPRLTTTPDRPHRRPARDLRLAAQGSPEADRRAKQPSSTRKPHRSLAAGRRSKAVHQARRGRPATSGPPSRTPGHARPQSARPAPTRPRHPGPCVPGLRLPGPRQPGLRLPARASPASACPARASPASACSARASPASACPASACPARASPASACPARASPAFACPAWPLPGLGSRPILRPQPRPIAGACAAASKAPARCRPARPRSSQAPRRDATG